MSDNENKKTNGIEGDLDKAVSNLLDLKCYPKYVLSYAYAILAVLISVGILFLAFYIICTFCPAWSNAKSNAYCTPIKAYWLIGFLVASVLILTLSIPVVFSSRRKQDMQFILDLKEIQLKEKAHQGNKNG